MNIKPFPNPQHQRSGVISASRLVLPALQLDDDRSTQFGGGLCKRGTIATAALSGYLSGRGLPILAVVEGDQHYSSVAAACVRYADALLVALSHRIETETADEEETILVCDTLLAGLETIHARMEGYAGGGLDASASARLCSEIAFIAKQAIDQGTRAGE